MCVDVDKPRQDRRSTEIDHRGASGYGELRANLRDAVALDEHDGVVDPAAGDGIDEMRRLDGDERRRGE